MLFAKYAPARSATSSSGQFLIGASSETSSIHKNSARTPLVVQCVCPGMSPADMALFDQNSLLTAGSHFIMLEC